MMTAEKRKLLFGLIVVFLILVFLYGCQRSIEVDVVWDEGVPVFFIDEERLGSGGIALRSVYVYQGTFRDRESLMWRLVFKTVDPFPEVSSPVRYGVAPDGFDVAVGPKPIKKCESYVVMASVARGLGYAEFESPCPD
ncbi:hypothetical protein VCB98_13655 [Gammaproteobacteria bacterium AB-CW1]|uniref:Lipoprotein n=1 Tax=Natronospira elongata TaxID=3110268 RepID=A0AAP6JGY4_9GAMM|nr:hypothetical protein [Gammaproteobacteria bacterium AB-CW1]